MFSRISFVRLWGLCIIIASQFAMSLAFAVNAPIVTIEYPICAPGHSCHALPNASIYPGTTINVAAKVTANPDDYLVNDPNNNGGGYVELYKDSTRVGSIKINPSNTPNYHYVQLLGCPAYICGHDIYLPYAFGTPTDVVFSYTFPVGVEGTYSFGGRFAGDDFTPAANSSNNISIKVSCTSFYGGTPPAGSGCP